MINWAEMERPSEGLAHLPISSDTEIKDNIRSKIEAFRKGYLSINNPGSVLFSFTCEEFSSLDSIDGKKIGRVASDRLQRLGFEVMRRAYGLDENTSKLKRLIETGDGIVLEVKSYPTSRQSSDKPTFRRIRRYNKVTGRTISVNWEVAKLSFFKMALR